MSMRKLKGASFFFLRKDIRNKNNDTKINRYSIKEKIFNPVISFETGLFLYDMISTKYLVLAATERSLNVITVFRNGLKLLFDF